MPTYADKFKENLDDVWKKHDQGEKNMLDRDEAKKFVEEISKLMIDKDRAKNFDLSKFDQLFDELVGRVFG